MFVNNYSLFVVFFHTLHKLGFSAHLTPSSMKSEAYHYSEPLCLGNKECYFGIDHKLYNHWFSLHALLSSC